MFEWRTDYETHINVIDEQHKRLFEIGRKCTDLLNNYISIDKYDRIVEMIEELRNYTVYHFSTEEEYLESISYKEFIRHKKEHATFIKKFNNVDLSNLDNNQEYYLLHVVEFVFKWIQNHILSEDLKYLQ